MSGPRKTGNATHRPRVKHERLWLLAILLMGALLRVAAFADYQKRIPVDYTAFTDYDNHTWHQFGLRIAEGGPLYRDAFVPCHSWARAIAPPEQWTEWYGGPSSFYQAPLYGYFVGGVYAVTGDEPVHVYAIQLMLGLVKVLLVYAVARRFWGGIAPLLAAFLAAIYSPAIFFELTLLRVTLLTVLHLSTLWLMIRAYQSGRAAAWAWVGLAAGVEFLAKPSPYPVAALALILIGAGGWRLRFRRLAAFALLLAVPLGLLVARNLTVGQPPLQVSTRGAVTFISGNAPGTVVDGPWGFYLPPHTADIIWQTHNSFPGTVIEVLRRQLDDPGEAARLWGAKIRAFWRDYEIPNNVNYYHARNLVAPLRLPFASYAFILPFAVLGFAITRRRWREFLPLTIPGLLVFLYTISFLVLSRMRLMIVPYLILFAAAGLVWVAQAIGARDLRRLLLAGMAVAVTLAVTARPPHWAPDTIASRFTIRDMEAFLRAARQQDPQVERAVDFEAAEAMLLAIKTDYEAGRYELCLEPLTRVLESYPDLAFTRYVLARCCFEIYLLDRDRSDLLADAERELARVWELEPDAPYAQGLKRALAGLREREAGAEPAWEGTWVAADGPCLRFIYGEDPETWEPSAKGSDHWITVAVTLDEPAPLAFGMLTAAGFVTLIEPGETSGRTGVPPGSLIAWGFRASSDDDEFRFPASLWVDTASEIPAALAVDPSLKTGYFQQTVCGYDLETDGVLDRRVLFATDYPRGCRPEACEPDS